MSPLSVAPTDYQSQEAVPLYFNSTSLTHTVRIIINDDAILEEDEIFFGQLSTIDPAVVLDIPRGWDL